MKHRQRGATTVVIIVIAFLMVAIVVSIIITLFASSQSSTQTVESSQSVQMEFICTTDHVDSSFYPKDNAEATTHEVRILFSQNNVNSIGYNYTGVYNSAEQAKAARDAMQIVYNRSWPKSSQGDPFNTTCNIVDVATLKIVHYGERASLTSESAPLLLLDLPDLTSQGSLNIQKVTDQYVSKGFNCKQKSN